MTYPLQPSAQTTLTDASWVLHCCWYCKYNPNKFTFT